MQRLHLEQLLLLQLPLPGLSLASPKRENALDKSSERRELASKGFLLYKLIPPSAGGIRWLRPLPF